MEKKKTSNELDPFKKALESLRVSDSQLPSEWAETNRILSGYAAEPGRFRLSRAPFQREWLDVIAKGHRRICIKKSAQVGATENLLNLIGYFIDQAKTPTPILVVYPTLSTAKRFSKDKLSTLLRDTPCIAERMDFQTRNSANAMLSKTFKGSEATLNIIGSNSPPDLSSQTIRILIADEIDKYADLPTGDAIALAEKRTTTFTNAIHYYLSTPTVRGNSKIDEFYESSDQRQYYVPCPHCEHQQTLVIERLVWDMGQAVYLCNGCGEKITHTHKQDMIESGYWKARYPERSMDMVGFHINEMYSPWSSWEKILKAKDRAANNPSMMVQFYNESLGLSYEIMTENAPAYQTHYDDRIPAINDDLPEEAAVLTAACDVQNDRLEVLILGWYLSRSIVVDRITLAGDTSQPDSECWQKLSDIIKRKWQHPNRGPVYIEALAIDTGHNTSQVYRWATKHRIREIMLVKGDSKINSILASPSDIEVTQDGRRHRIAHKLWRLNTSILKQDIYSRLKANDPESQNYMQFTEVCDDDFFKQLTSEVQVPHRLPNGEVKQVWKKIHRHNHVLDLYVYNLAVYYREQFHHFSHGKWDDLKSGDYDKNKRAYLNGQRAGLRESNARRRAWITGNGEWGIPPFSNKNDFYTRRIKKIFGVD